MLLHLFFFFSHFLGQTAAATIYPENGLKDVSGTEGERVTLRCNYETTYDDVYLHWYRQDSGLQAPQYLLQKGAKSASSYEDIPDKRYESKTTDSSTEITINKLTLADSALYYCAVRLTFGEAIKLSVRPRDLSPVKPSLSVLSPLDPCDPGGPGVCLAAGFRPPEGEMVLNGSNSIDISEEEAVVSPRQKTFFFTGFSDGAISSCEMNNVSSSNDHADSCDNVHSTDSHDDNNSADSHDDIHSKNVRFNSYLLLLNAARVMFTKIVAFTSVLTIRTLLA
nr:T cell receptor delta chain V-D-J-C2 [Paralichthys olivaceus]